MVVLQEVVPDLFLCQTKCVRTVFVYGFPCIWHCARSLSWSPTEWPCGMAGLWHSVWRARRGGWMCLGQPTTQTHCCCLYLAKQNTRERKRDTHRHRERKGEQGEIFHLWARGKMGCWSTQEECIWEITGVGEGLCVHCWRYSLSMCTVSTNFFCFFKKCFDCIERWRHSSSTSSNADIFLNENLVFKNNCQILKIRSLLYLYYFKLLYNLMTFVLQTLCILTL